MSFLLKAALGTRGMHLFFHQKMHVYLIIVCSATAAVIDAVVALYVAAVANLTVDVVDIRGFCCCCCALCWS